MVARDPSTGEFVSGPDGRRLEAIGGDLALEIPAADLSGGTVTEEVIGERATIIDMSGKLEANEQFQVQHAWFSSVLYLPTTATAEGTAAAEIVVSTDGDMQFAGASNPFWGAPVGVESGIIDGRQADTRDSSVLLSATLAATPSVADTTNGLAAGSDIDRLRTWMPGRGVRLDEDDEIYVPTELSVDNVSDHAVAVDHTVVLWGHEVET